MNSTPLVVFIERVKAIPNNTLRVICVFFLLLVIILKLATNNKVAAWFDANWFYRQSLQVTNSSGSNLTQYQVSFVLDTSTLITAGKMKTDCADIRITDPTGSSLPLWIEESTTRGCNTTTTNIWIKVPSISLFGTSLYVYYGNPQSVTISNGKSVFEQFDSFSKNVIDQSVWNVGAGLSSPSNGTLSLVNNSKIVSKLASTNSSGIGRLIFRAKTAATNLTGGRIGLSSINNLSSIISSGESSYASFGGLEEKLSDFGSNLVSHYKLEETTSSDANQFKASGYLDTGKLSQAVSLYGNAAGTDGSTLTFNRGAQISGTNFEHINANQGSISFWLKEGPWASDNYPHYFLMNWYTPYVLKNAGNVLNIGVPMVVSDAASGFNISSWTGTAWHNLTLIWDTDNNVYSTNKLALYVDGVYKYSISSVGWTAMYPDPTFYIGNAGAGATQRGADTLIDDFAIFDRVLTTTEITNIYNTGTGREAGYVADPSLKFYAKMDGTGTLSPVTYNLGASASKMTAKSTELTGGTNLVADGDMEDAGTASWATSTSATISKNTSSVFADTQSLLIQPSTGASNAYQSISVVVGQTYYFSIWVKATSTVGGNGWVSIDNTNDGFAGTYLFGQSGVDNIPTSWSKLEGVIKIPSGFGTNLRIHVGGGGNSMRVDNFSLTPSLVDNGGMEGTYVAGVAPGWVAYVTPTTLADETTTIHSGGHSQKVVTTDVSGVRSPDFTVTVGRSYLISAWVYLVSGSIQFRRYDGSTLPATASIDLSTTGSWTKLTIISQAIATGAQSMRFSGLTPAAFYVDDVSFIPLDNVAGSLKQWTPVSDAAGANKNPLSINGGSTGVASNATGSLNNAYTFDGSTGYLRQKTYAVNIGTLSYGTNTFTDDGQTFSGYKSAPASAYMIVITNSDNTTSWGYIGAGGAATLVNVYTTIAEGTAGFNGTSPTGKTPVGYEIRKTDYQITGNLTVGAWVKKTNATHNDATIIANQDYATCGGNSWTGFDLSTGGSYGYMIRGANANIASVGSSNYADTNWHFVVAAYNGSSWLMYVDGLSQTLTGSADTPSNGASCPFNIAMRNGANAKWNGSIDSPFVLNTALTADQVKALYNYGSLTTSHTGTKSTPGNSANPVYDTSYHTYDISVGVALVAARQDNVLFSSSSTNLPNTSQFMRIENSDPTNNLTLDWIASAKQASTAPVAAAPATEEKSTNPIAYWKLDEGNGSLAHDSSSNRNDGTLSGSTLPTWQSEDMCISGKCLYFQGNASYIDAGSTVGNYTDNFTASAWVRTATNNRRVLARRISGGVTQYDLFLESVSGRASLYDGASEFRGTSTLSDNKWHFISWSINGANSKIYVDGKLEKTFSPNIVAQNTKTLIGAFQGSGGTGIATSTVWNGFLDDIKIYPYARTAAQIKSDYNSRGAQKGASVNSSSLNPIPYTLTPLSQGLVGYWRMNEATWSGTIADVIDSSGNGNTGTAQGATNGKAYPTTGKFGNAGYFDGVDDYVTASITSLPSSSNARTMSIWFKLSTATLPSTPGKEIIGWGNNTGIGKRFSFWYDTSSKLGIEIQNESVLFAWTPDTNWHNLIATYPNNGKLSDVVIYFDGISKTLTGGTNTVLDTSAGQLKIGGIPTITSGNYNFSGQIDEARIYNRSLSPAEVSALYNYSPARVAYWNLDEKQGTTANDTSGNANTGTLQTGVLSSALPLWTQGKLGAGLSFNGIDNYLTANDSATLDQSGSFSLSALIKPSAVGSSIVGGTILSKGKNYDLRVVRDDKGNSRVGFTTNAITTQLSGTAINDVYFYDTTKDTNYGDGTANDPLVWRFDSTKSWYSETKDHTYAACNISTDDRCGVSEFPEKSYIVATATNVYIYDAQENAMWMRFDYGGGSWPSRYLLNGQPTSTFALNGKIYAGFGGGNGLVRIDIPLDKGRLYGTSSFDWGSPAQTLANRNANATFTGNGTYPVIVNATVNDVHAAVISGKTYVAVATDGGVSVINETDGTVVNLTSTSTYVKANKAFLTPSGKLYFTAQNSNSIQTYHGLYALYSIPSSSQQGSGAYRFISGIKYYSHADETSAEAINLRLSQTSWGGNSNVSLYVTEGTSTIDGTSNTIFIGTSVGGLTILQEKQGDEANGSVKYFTKDYITEEMVGDIRGMWDFSRNVTLSNSDSVLDASVKATDLTSVNGATVLANGVRGKGFTFNGSTQYLKQKVYLSTSQVTRVDTAGSAAIELTGLATYKTTTQPYAYMIVSTNCTTTGWGYLGATIAGDNTKVFSTRTGTTQNWAAVGSGGTCDSFEVRKTDFQITGNLSVGAWVKTSTNPSVNSVFSKGRANPGYSYALFLNSGKADMFIGNCGDATGTSSINDNAWHFITGVKDSANVIKIYVDGQLQGTKTSCGGAPDVSVPFVVGGEFGTGSPTLLFTGSIDEPFVTASALTADEIKRMYEVGKRSLTAAGTSGLNGTSNQVNAVVAGGLSHFVLPNNQLRITNNKMYAGTAGGGVSEIDLNSDTLVNSFTSSSTPPINSSNVTALTLTSGGNFIAALDSGLSRVNDVTGRNNPTPTKWISLAGIFNKDTGYYYLYENGIEVGRTNVGTGHTPIANSNPFILGSSTGGTATLNVYPFYGSIDQTSIYNYPVNNITLNSPARKPAGTGVIASGAKKSLSPIAYYDFDEGTGTLVHNLGTGGTGLNGTTSNTSWSLNGKVNKALSFNGTSSYVDLGNSANIDFINTNPYSISLWYKSQANPGTGLHLIGKRIGCTTGTIQYQLADSTVANGGVSFYEWDSTGAHSLFSNVQATLNEWTHIIFTYNGSLASIYINGVLKNSANLVFVNNHVNSNLKIGVSGTCAKTNGLLDETKIYNYALTADEVKTDYNRGSSLVLGSVSTDQTTAHVASNSASAKYCVPGDIASCAPPVGEWNFEEGKGVVANDTSGNNNTGNFGAGTAAPKWTQGKIGKALKFDGVNDYVDVGNGTSLNLTSKLTYSVWYKRENSTGYPCTISKGSYVNSWDLSQGNLRIGGFSVVDHVFSGDTNNVWHNIAFTYDNSLASNNLNIYLDGILVGTWADTHLFRTTSNSVTFGKIQSDLSYFKGLIDQVKIYNYARTPAQIAWDYNKGEPVAYYDFDECTGSVIHDRSTNRLDGTLTNATPGTCTDGTGTSFWSAGQTGKYGKSGKFDGVDDYVIVNNLTSLTQGNITISAWIRSANPTNGRHAFISKNLGTGTGFMLELNSTYGLVGGITFWNGYNYDVNSTTILQPNVWYHIVGVFNGVNRILYINGKQEDIEPTTLGDITSSPLYIGAASWAGGLNSRWNDQLDEVKIFNYALTNVQVKQLYNQNSAIRFGQ